MLLDEITYVAILVGSIPIGLCLKQMGSVTREVGASVIGFSIVAATCGLHTVHSVICISVTWFITRFCSRNSYNLTLAWMFLYLLFFRLLVISELAHPSPFTNAVQLLLTLKMVSVAAEMTPVVKESDPPGSNPPPNPGPSLRSILTYSYCYMGIITGPFYRYHTFQDWLGEKDLGQIPSLGPLIHRLRWSPLYAASFLAASYLFPQSFAQSEEFASAGFLYILLYTAAIFFVFRMRFYTAWTVSEASCMAAGLGAYPVSSRPKPGLGPSTRGEQTSDPKIYNYETIRNINPYKTDFCSSVKDGMRNWNMTVQWWLANYIYRRAPFQTRMLRVGWTMLVSAFWHGVHPGYYLSFLTIPLCLAAEGVMDTGVRERLGNWGQKVYDGLHWFWSLRAYDYMCVGFVFLGWRETLIYWGHLYFYQHLLACVLFITGYLLTPPDRRSPPRPVSPPVPPAPIARSPDNMDFLRPPPTQHELEQQSMLPPSSPPSKSRTPPSSPSKSRTPPSSPSKSKTPPSSPSKSRTPPSSPSKSKTPPSSPSKSRTSTSLTPPSSPRPSKISAFFRPSKTSVTPTPSPASSPHPSRTTVPSIQSPSPPPPPPSSESPPSSSTTSTSSKKEQ